MSAIETSVQSELPIELIESKLALPVGRAGSVWRTDLVERLSSAGEPVIVVAAPAGYGKTTVLGQWAESDSRPVAWVSLDPRDSDPITLLTYLAVALDRIEPIGASVFAALRSPGTPIWSSVIPRLGSALATRSDPVMIVLDDVHRVEGRESLDAIAAITDHVPPDSSLVLSSRGEPDLGLPRLRAQARAFELGVEDLRFDEDDATTVLRGAGLELSDTDVVRLIQGTEGWPAGLYLAVLSLRAGGSQAEVSEFVGSDRFVSDYFREEVLARLSHDEVEFLVAASVLGRMCGPLCDAVMERTGSAAVLEAFERSNLFLVPLDQRHQWYRFHHLFRELLQAELAREGQERIRELNRRASVWKADNGDPEAAIRYAKAANDKDLLCDLIAQNAVPVYHSGRLATVDTWLGWFDDRDLVRYPLIAVLGGWTRLFTGRSEEAERWAHAAEIGAAHYAGALPDGSASITSWIAPLRACLCAEGPEQMREDAETALAGLAPQSTWCAAAKLLLGIAHHLTGDDERADTALSEAAELAMAAGESDTVIHALGQRALLAMGRREIELARELLAVSDDPPSGMGSYATHAIWLAARARLLQLTGDLEGARREFTNAQRLRPLLTWGFGWNAVQVRLELARVCLGLGDVAAGRVLLAEIEAILRHRPRLGVLVEATDDLKRQLASRVGVPGNWASTLTSAELRLLPMLATHLTLQEIADRQFVSRNTVKSAARSIYQKLDATSRSEAVAHAVELGLIDAAVVPVTRGVAT